MQLATHFTALICGDGTYAIPPEPAANDEPPPPAATATSANPATRQPLEGL
jgi:hypothetical protein